MLACPGGEGVGQSLRLTEVATVPYRFFLTPAKLKVCPGTIGGGYPDASEPDATGATPRNATGRNTMQQHFLTVTEVARLYGKARSTIHRAMSAGRLSSTVRGDGVRVIALSECIRCWGEPAGQPPETQQDATAHSEPTQQGATPEVFAAMLEELQALRAEVSELKQHMMRLPAPDDSPQAGGTHHDDAGARDSLGSADDVESPESAQEEARPIGSFADLLSRFDSRH